MNVINEKRNDTYKRLAKVASSVGINESKFLELLVVPDTPGADGSLNLGNAVTNDLKLLVKVKLALEKSGAIC